MSRRLTPPECFLLAPCDPAEAQARFDMIEEHLRAFLPRSADIQHDGATAVPGCRTKGDLDVCVRVTKDAFAESDALLARRFPRNEESGRTEYFAAFLDLASNAGIQLVVAGSPLDVVTAFRDTLLGSPSYSPPITISSCTITARQ
jgi:GrpB-like predicted nucleotidyltransferase (UPF0157 family)